MYLFLSQKTMKLGLRLIACISEASDMALKDAAADFWTKVNEKICNSPTPPPDSESAAARQLIRL